MKIDLSTDSVGAILDLMNRAGMKLSSMTLAKVLDCSITKAHALALNASMLRRGCGYDFIVEECGFIDGAEWGRHRAAKTPLAEVEQPGRGNC